MKVSFGSGVEEDLSTKGRKMRILLVLLLFVVSCGTIPVNETKNIYITTGCSRVRVERIDTIIRSNGKEWVVVRLNACGEKMVFEKVGNTWRYISWRMR